MSLSRPEKKMSKSDREDEDGDKSCIGLFEDERTIRQKVRAAVTDTGTAVPGGGMSPGVANLFEILRACEQPDAAAQLQKDYDAGTLKYSKLKDAVADGLVQLTTTLRKRREEIEADADGVDALMQDMADKARSIASETVLEVRRLAGLPTLRG